MRCRTEQEHREEIAWKKQSAAALLWHVQLYDTMDLAEILDLPEHEICRVVDAYRTVRQRQPNANDN